MYLDRHRSPLDIDRVPARLSSSRRGSQRSILYRPGEALLAFCQRTGWPSEEVVRLNRNESPYGLLPAARAALVEVRYNYYSEVTALVKLLGAYTGLSSGDRIVVGHGSMDLLDRLWFLFATEGDTVIGCPPTYGFYDALTCRYGATPLAIMRRRYFALNVDLLLDEHTASTQLIVLCSPNNLTGTVVAEGEVRRLLDTGRIVLLDEAYVEFSDRPQGMVHLLAEYPNLVACLWYCCQLSVSAGASDGWLYASVCGMRSV